MENKNYIPAIECCSVNLSYGTDHILRDISFEIRKNSLCALVGPNGSGKTTLVKSITGLLKTDSGNILINSNDISTKPGKEEVKKIGYVQQQHNLTGEFPASVFEIVSSQRVLTKNSWFRLRKNDIDEIEHAIESVGLKEKMYSPFHELSGGQKQRVLIAKAFAGEPDILILDEPTAGVDTKSQELFKEALEHSIEDHDITVLLVSHDLASVSSLVEQIIVLKNEIVFDGLPSDLEKQGVSLGVHTHDLPVWLEHLKTTGEEK